MCNGSSAAGAGNATAAGCRGWLGHPKIRRRHHGQLENTHEQPNSWAIVLGTGKPHVRKRVRRHARDIRHMTDPQSEYVQDNTSDGFQV